MTILVDLGVSGSDSCGRGFGGALCYGFISSFTLFRQSNLGSLLVLKRTLLAMSWKGWLNWTSVDEVSGVGCFTCPIY